MRRSLAWLVAVPLMLAGSQVAHALAYRIVYPQASVRLQDLVETGHGYMSALPLALGVAGAIVVLSLAATAADAALGRGVRPLPLWVFALLPVVGFAIQEYVERWLSWGFFPWYACLQPTFMIGIALQVPFGVLAYLAARLLVRAARHVGRRLARVAPPRPRVVPPPFLAPLQAAAAAAAVAARAPARPPRASASRRLRRAAVYADGGIPVSRERENG